jgi:hypothetical protein
MHYLRMGAGEDGTRRDTDAGTIRIGATVIDGQRFRITRNLNKRARLGDRKMNETGPRPVSY